MGILDYKLNPVDYVGNRVIDLKDRPCDKESEGGDGYNSTMLKASFDYIPIEILGKKKHNGLIDFLAGEGFSSDVLAKLPNGEFAPLADVLECFVASVEEGGNIKYIRLNSDKVLETSQDGETWEATGSSGHIILDGDGEQMAQRSRLQFLNAVVKDDGETTIISGIKGEIGETGATGAMGSKGEKGETGASGEKGDLGKMYLPQVDSQGVISWQVTEFEEGVLPIARNIRGMQGVQGVQGNQGLQGLQGLQGNEGPRGLQGEAGPQGERGARGIQGATGIKGDKGATGAKGERGETGEQGIQGVQGEQGIQGIQGRIGEKGDVGETGARGAQGVQGEQGIQGIQGETGERGLQGVQGVPGAVGQKGEKGDVGASGNTFVVQDIYPTLADLMFSIPLGNEYAYQVAEDHQIYLWSELATEWVSMGKLQGPSGERGETGEQGVQGIKGDPGEQGVRGIQGEKGEQGIQGEKGEKGDRGEAGVQGVQGEQGIQGEQGEQGVQGEKGEKGDTGDVGIQGIQGEIGATGETGPEGPRGATGSQGATGLQGVQGVQGPQGLQGKSAFDTATEGGYVGTSAEFAVAIAGIGNKASNQDISDSVSQHNLSITSHADLRTAIAEKANIASTYSKTQTDSAISQAVNGVEIPVVDIVDSDGNSVVENGVATIPTGGGASWEEVTELPTTGSYMVAIKDGEIGDDFLCQYEIHGIYFLSDNNLHGTFYNTVGDMMNNSNIEICGVNLTGYIVSGDIYIQKIAD